MQKSMRTRSRSLSAAGVLSLAGCGCTNSTLHSLKVVRLRSPQAGLSTKLWKNIENVEPYLKAIGNMRGPGWALLYFDPQTQQFLAGFSGEQHQGHFATLPVILALDVWEHAYLLDYGTQGKGKYIDAFFKNLNWKVVEERYAKLSLASHT